MTPEDRRALIKDIVDVLEARAIEPLKRHVNERFAALEAKDKTHERTHASKATVSDVAASTDGALAGLGAHVGKLATGLEQFRAEMRAELADTNSQLAALAKQGAAQLVPVKDGKGSTSMVPAATVAAARATVAAARVEGKTEAIQVAADRADTQSLAAKIASKRAAVIVIIQTVLIAAWQAYQYIAAHVG